MEWRPSGWSVCLPLLIFPCTIKSRGSLLALAHPGGLGERAVKRLWRVVWWCLIRSAAVVCCVGIDALHCEFAHLNKININAHISTLTLLVGWQEGHPARKKYGEMVEVSTGYSGLCTAIRAQLQSWKPLAWKAWNVMELQMSGSVWEKILSGKTVHYSFTFGATPILSRLL